MPAFLAQTKLSKGDLRLYLINQDGYPQDAFDVRWTVYSSDGAQISGKNLCAIKANTGEYYAPWSVTSRAGNYFIQWQWQEESGDLTSVITENLFVVNLTNCGPCGLDNSIASDVEPNAGEFTYLRGAILGPGDLPFYAKDLNGFLIDPFGVFWTIYDACGIPITPKTSAARISVGEYYAYWVVNAQAGDYVITWDYMEQDDSPPESKSMRFSVINGCGLVACDTPCTPIYTPIIPPTPSPMNQCCSYEISRVVHLTTQTLPAGGAWTNQPVYIIPKRIRQLAFYISYTRGANGGYPIFKLLWGNGVEESQETMIDLSDVSNAPSTAIQNMYLQDLAGPVPETNSPVNSILYINVPGGAVTVRLLASEKGQLGTPGSVGITLTAAS
jgi:hypothetical protein